MANNHLQIVSPTVVMQGDKEIRLNYLNLKGFQDLRNHILAYLPNTKRYTGLDTELDALREYNGINEKLIDFQDLKISVTDFTKAWFKLSRAKQFERAFNTALFSSTNSTRPDVTSKTEEIDTTFKYDALVIDKTGAMTFTLGANVGNGTKFTDLKARIAALKAQYDTCTNTVFAPYTDASGASISAVPATTDEESCKAHGNQLMAEEAMNA